MINHGKVRIAIQTFHSLEKINAVVSLLPDALSTENNNLAWVGAYDAGNNDQFVWIGANDVVPNDLWDVNHPNHGTIGDQRDCAVLFFSVEFFSVSCSHLAYIACQANIN